MERKEKQNMLRIAVLDNDRRDAELLVSHLKRYERESGIAIEVSVFEDGALFLLNYKKPYDAAFLDIRLADLDGLETARRLRNFDQSVVLVFVSTHSEYAIRGYEVDACDFVLKPLAYTDFVRIFQKVRQRIKRGAEDIVMIKTANCLAKISASNIYYVEVMKHDLIYHTAGGSLVSHGTMRETEQLLRPYGFFRVHHGYLVNLYHVREVRGDIVAVGGAEIRISRAKKEAFLRIFSQF